MTGNAMCSTDRKTRHWDVLSGAGNGEEFHAMQSTSSFRGTSGKRSTIVGIAVTLMTAVAVVFASPAYGAFGDEFGIAPINDGGLDTSPAYPGQEAFWAGVCDRRSAPAFGDPIPAPGVGSRPNTILAPTSQGGVSVAAPLVPQHCIDWGASHGYDFLTTNTWTQTPQWRLAPVTDAGAHPDGSTTLAFRRSSSSPLFVDGTVDNIIVDLPPGFVGNPQAVAECPAENFAVNPPNCPRQSQVGVLNLHIQGAIGGANLPGDTDDAIYPVWNLEPRQGRAAELGFAYASGERITTVRLEAKVRSGSDNGVTGFVGQIPAALSVVSQGITLWGVPWEAANDAWRAREDLVPNTLASCSTLPESPGTAYYIPPKGLSSACQATYDPSWGDVKPFLTTETDCNPVPVTTLRMDQYLHPGAFTSYGEPDASDPDWVTGVSPSPAVVDCESLEFGPGFGFAATSSRADGASGLDVDLSVPQNNDLPFPKPAVGASGVEVDGYLEAAADHWRSDDGRATAHLKDSVVTLPAGVSVNPSSATGLVGCPDGVVGVREQGDPPLFNLVDPVDGVGVECPAGSRLGTVEVDTPLLDETLTGDVVLGEPKSTDPGSGEMFRLFLVVRSKARGLLVKVYGSAVADPQTGRITATFRNNPELPFSDLRLDFKAGAKGVLALPQQCGNPAWTAAFTPWSAVGAATPVPDAQNTGDFAVDQNCSNTFAPGLHAGMDTRAARGNGTFTFRFSRQEGEQYLRGLTAQLPQGLLASVKDLPLCTNSQADAGSCPAASKIGVVDAKAGSGDPFVLEEKGEVFLTEGYKGGPYGLAVKIRPVAGPFRGAMELSPIIVRQKIEVDRTSAQVTAVSDPFPLIHHGVPLRVREVTVVVNRDRFMLNPSDCASKQVGADFASDQAAGSTGSNAFQAAGCAGLAFKPSLTLALTGKKQRTTGKHPGIKAQVTQKGIGEAGIEKAEVRLPKSLALDPDNAQALCEFADGTKDDLENHCPKGSIVGRSRATSPLLNDPLVGNVYFVKNIRIDKKSGNEIRTLPMIIVALRGEIAINLKGESDTTKDGKLVNTFNGVPDAPVSKFNLNIKGGKTGILAVTRTRRSLIHLCAKPRGHVAEADMDGQNGRRHDFDVRMKTPCSKRQTKAAKRAAKRAAKARNARG
jgi:hypothetical protein